MTNATAPMTLDQLDELEANGMVNAETAQILQNFIEWMEDGEGVPLWDYMGGKSREELKAWVLEDDANEPREWSAEFDWEEIDWVRLYGYLPHVCGVSLWRTPEGKLES